MARYTAPGDDITPGDYRKLAELRHQLRLFLHFSENAARQAGIEPQQHQLLLAMKGLPPGRRATVGELAERLQVRHHSLVGLLDRLCERGLARRHRDDDDRRQVLVEVTAEGERLLRDLSRSHREELVAIGPRLMRTLRDLVADAQQAPSGAPNESGSRAG